MVNNLSTRWHRLRSCLVNLIMALLSDLVRLPHGPRRHRVEAARRALSERAFQDVAEIEKPAQ